MSERQQALFTSAVPAVGSRLENGATVLEVVRVVKGLVILALSHQEFVTWAAAMDGTGTTWGHYHRTDLREALADLDERADRYGRACRYCDKRATHRQPTLVEGKLHRTSPLGNEVDTPTEPVCYTHLTQDFAEMI